MSTNAEQLRARLDEIRKNRTTVEDKTKSVRQTQPDDDVHRENVALKDDLDKVQKSSTGKRDKIKEQNEFIASIPSETQLLKLERKLESTKAQLADAERTANQLTTGIDAYRERCRVCSASRKELADRLDVASCSAHDEVAIQSANEAQTKSSQVILAAIDDLIAICEDRESQLLDLNQKYTEKIEADGRLSERIASLHSSVEAELPRIDAEADRFTREITAAWTREKQLLQSVYDKFYVVHQEQQFHLQRGTHVKRDAEPIPQHEQALSARHARLAAQLIDARSRLNELAGENAYAKRTMAQLREEGRDAVQHFDALKQEVAERLKQAQNERVAAETESRRFRTLKADLQDALQAIRETPSGATKTA